MMRPFTFAALCAGLALSAALPASRAQALDNHGLVMACMQMTGVKGNYDYAPEAAIPRMRALDGGTSAGAARLNACIEQSIDIYRPAYTGRITADMDDLQRGRILVAMANERNGESAPCQMVLTGGTGYDLCHRPW